MCYSGLFTTEDFILLYEFIGNNIFINESATESDNLDWYINSIRVMYEHIAEKFNELPENFMKGYVNSFSSLFSGNTDRILFIKMFNKFSAEKFIQFIPIENFYAFFL